MTTGAEVTAKDSIRGSTLDRLQQTISVELVLGILDALPNGLLVCDINGRVLLANEAARREIQTGMTFELSADGCIRGAHDATSRMLRVAIESAGRGSRSLISVGENEQRVFLATESLPSRGGGERSVLLLLNRSTICSEIALQLLGKLYGLTHSEREVLAGLLEGQRVQQLAATRERKISTLRAQIVTLKTKLNVSRIDDLLRLTALLPWTQDARRSYLGPVSRAPASQPKFLPQAEAATSRPARPLATGNL